jgi:putative endonuclease
VLWLRCQGYAILARRVTCGRGAGAGEIDVVARRAGLVAFIEIKARPSLEEAGGAITPRQRQRLRRGAEAFLARHPELSA